MELEEQVVRRLIVAMASTIAAHADELTSLDRAIGDGDHGINMQRGFDAVLADLDRIVAKPLPEALAALGMTLVMKVGGASGPLYGTLFMQLGRALPASPGLAELLAAGEAALAAVKARGKSDVGAKTMLDVLAPALAALREGAAAARLVEVAHAAAEATTPMRAWRGRASFLGERSIGHMDPGARSSALLIAAATEALAGAAP
jgi:dihydroxyacetone kinase-like protein